jgi:ferric-dicitrate binding protein FerR (iron transport regulator)
MRRDDEKLLNDAVRAMQADEPDAAQVAASAGRVAARLNIGFVASGDRFSNALRLTIVNRSAPATTRASDWQPRRFGWALAACFALMACALFLYKAYWQIPAGVRAEVRSVDGFAYRISNTGDRPLSAGDKLAEGEHLRTSGGAHAVLQLTDGSTVEVNERSDLGVGARGRSMTVTLDTGSVIVQAAKGVSGHLYVKTPDCRVAFTETIFSVNAGIKGSRVAVLQGSVHVMHDGVDTLIEAGGQVATSGNLGAAPVEDQIAWSHDRDKYLTLLAQLSAPQNQVNQIPFPSPGSTSEMANSPNSSRIDHPGKKVLENSGKGESQYSIAEHPESNGQPENHMNLQMAGTSQGVAVPAPMASHDFITPKAAIAAPVAKFTVAQLEQTLATAHDRPDAEVARQLSGLELSERLNTAKLAQLKADMPGDKAREQLVILADSAAFLDPPAAEIPADAAPDPAAAHQMLTQVVNYVNTTTRQLPNLIAVRDTIGFEDQPQEDVQGETGIATTAAMPLHTVGKSSVSVTYSDHKEVVDKKAVNHGAHINGLATSGEFGPVLIVVVGDALQGKITWGRWEQGANGKEAVFHYAVPSDKAHYPVQFCCQYYGLRQDTLPAVNPFKEIVGYHGEIVFDPASGAILRITMESELPHGELVTKASLMIEYSSVEIGGQKYICPVRSISNLKAYDELPTGMFSMSKYRGPTKNYLRDVAFSQYRSFGTESRILAGGSLAPGEPSGPVSADSPNSIPSRAVTH